ncbi:MAG: AAA family ATPase [Leptospiraceae bacterium]|nr:AAA family ATPase [Leptospiraceae bacterium]
MITVSKYRIEEQVHAGNKNILFRGVKEDNSTSVIFKVLNIEYPTNEDLETFKQEFEIQKKLSYIPGIIKAIGMQKYRNGYVMLFEDIGGVSLEKHCKENKLSLKQFIDLAIKITEILGKIHSENVIHKDIKPHNIIINPKTNELKITDFGSASFLSRENPVLITKSLEGTISYISPEQTGRMNRTIDYRTDFYSLGVLFYELLTGDLPFKAEDAMELIHSHIAIKPVPPAEKDSKIPKALSDIVLKLMSKAPEDRYQSTMGIIADLEECLNQIGTKGEISPFELGTKDISNKFQIPEKLYGREAEVQNLIATFRTTTDEDREGKRNLQLMLVSGHPGIGKSALINEINKPIVEYKGYFVSGKYDQYRKNTPYSAIIQAFQELVGEILSESKEVISQWRIKLLEALGNNGQVIVDVIPEIELIIGKQPEIPSLGPTEQQNRFNMVFQNFIKVFATKEHPLSLFLDDLQWADTPSMHLLKEVYISQDIHYLFFIFAYRDNEVDSTHPFYLMLEDLKKQGYTYKEISLKPLAVEHINSIVADTLHSNYKQTEGLAKILKNKTGGNPFFVNEFLKTLYKESLIYYKNGWKWDETKIQEAKITDNVVELMADKIIKLPDATREVMKYASCMGIKFYLDTLSVITGKSEEELYESLKEAVTEGMVLISKEYAKFVHDRVREATYSLLSEEDKINNHYKIGKSLLNNTSEDKLDERIFVIVGQLNSGAALIQDAEERLQLAKLNLQAGKKAKESTAYEGALNFLNAGINFLPEDSWMFHYELTFEIYKELSESEYLATNFENADKLYEVVLKNTTSLMDKVKIYNLQLRQKASELQPDEAFKVGFAALNELGVETPDPTDSGAIQAAIGQQLEEYKELLGTRPIPSLYDLQDMTNRNMREAISLVTNLGDIAIAMKGEMLPLMSILGVNLSLKYGNAEVSPISYVMTGVITNLVFRDYQKGYELGQLAIRISQEKFPSDLIFAKVYAFYGWNINHYIHHLKEDLEIAKKGYNTSMANSDIVFAGYFVLMLLQPAWCLGRKLDEVLDYGEKSLTFATKYKFVFASSFAMPTVMVIHALQGKTENPLSFNSETHNEDRYIQENSSFGQCMAYFYLRKYQLYIYYGEYKKCLEIYPYMEKYYFEVAQHIAYAEVRFCYALSLIALMPEFSEEEKAIYEPKFKESYEFFELWTTHCEDNFKHKYLLIKAEKARIEENDSKAMQCYNEAIQLAKKYEYINDAALANELEAKFFLTKNMEQVAAVYIRESHYLYRQWGAAAKVKDLESKYGNMLQTKYSSDSFDVTTNFKSTTSIRSSTTSHLGSAASILDLGTINKATQAMTGEIVLEKLLEKMMKIMFENAGAQKGMLILNRDNMLVIEAEGSVEKGIKVLQSIVLDKIEDTSSIPIRIISYVARTKKFLVLNDAVNEGAFTNSPYVQKNKPKSIICLPIIHQDKMAGIVFLENNLTTGAFTADRIEVLNIISSPAAISIENARLYAQLENVTRKATEMEIAKQIQTGLLPPSPALEGYEVTGFMRTADEVGGDYYDVFNDGEQDWLVIGDVSGHGVPAGLVMMMAQTSIHTAIKTGKNLSLIEIMKNVNNVLSNNIKMMGLDKYMTITVFTRTSEDTFIYAGLHQPLFIYRAATGDVNAIDTSGSWWGLEDMFNDFDIQEIKFNQGDTLLLYTDGITEGRDKNDKMFDEVGLLKFMQQNGSKSTVEIKDELLKILKDYYNDDDITFVVIKKK